jgi:hypothetical protein
MNRFLTEHTRVTEVNVEMLIVLSEPRVPRERIISHALKMSQEGDKVNEMQL